MLIEQLNTQKKENDRNISRIQQQYENQISNYNKILSSFTTSTTVDGDSQLRSKVISLEMEKNKQA